MRVCFCLRWPLNTDGTGKLSSTRLVLRLEWHREPGEVSRRASKNLRLRSSESKCPAVKRFPLVPQPNIWKIWHKYVVSRVFNRTPDSHVLFLL